MVSKNKGFLRQLKTALFAHFIPNLTPKLCAWILWNFCSVPGDKRQAKIPEGETYLI